MPGTPNAIKTDDATSTDHFADRLIEAIRSKGSPVCVGLDPVYEQLPDVIRPNVDRGPSAALDAIVEFSSIVLDAVADHIPVVKFQSACFERYRADGVDALYSLIEEARQQGLLVILDAKRGDIGLSAAHYSSGIFSPWVGDDDLPLDGSLDDLSAAQQQHCSVLDSNPDAVTVNSYLGMDGIEPFTENGHGVFALVRTSNPGSDAIQSIQLETGISIAEHIAGLVHELAQESIGESGYSLVGAVVGATKREDIESLREIMPNSMFLVPGYGAQGGTADDVKACFNAHDGLGALITSSRGIIHAFDAADEDWASSVAKAASQFNAEIRAIVPTSA